jgi:hypothetical protein
MAGIFVFNSVLLKFKYPVVICHWILLSKYNEYPFKHCKNLVGF